MFNPPALLDGLPKRTSGFDFLVGDWQVANRRLSEPLTGSDTWYEAHATASATTMHNGAIGVDEMWYPELGFAGSSIRVHAVADDTWTICWVNSDTGHLHPRSRDAGPTTAPGSSPPDPTATATCRWRATCGTPSATAPRPGSRRSRSTTAPPGRRTG